MQNGYQRTHKIQLTISRRKKVLGESISNGQAEESKCQGKMKTMRKMIDLTLCSRVTWNKPRPQNNSRVYFSQNTKMSVSQFMISSKHESKMNQVVQPVSMLNSVRELESNEDQDKWWEYLKCSEQDSDFELIRCLLKNCKKIQYFAELIAKNRHQYDLQKRDRVRKYESYMTKMREMYVQQLQQAQALDSIIKELDQRRSEDFYRQLRLKINKDGKKGLNFSPKRLSLLSGVADTILISNRSSGSGERRRGANEFSFGSSLQKKTNYESLMKQGNEAEFQKGGVYRKKVHFSNT